MLEHHPYSPVAHISFSLIALQSTASQWDEYLFPYLFFSITQYPYFWVSGKQGTLQGRYFFSAVKKLAQSAGAPMINIASEYFEAGQNIEITDETLELFKPNGYFYGPFRQSQNCVEVPDYENYKRFLVVRDPRDILTSFYFSARFSHRKPGQTEGDVREENTKIPPIEKYVIKQANKMLPRWRKYVEMLSSDPDLKVYKYEYIIDNFEDWARDVSEHCTLPAKEKMIQALAEKHVSDVSIEDVRKHRRQIRSGDHARKLDQETIDKLDIIFADVLDAFGYK